MLRTFFYSIMFVFGLFSSSVFSQDTKNVSANNSESPEIVISAIDPGDITGGANATAFGFTVDATYKLEFDSPGYFVGVAIPKQYSQEASTELLLGYGSINYDQMTGTVNVTDGSTTASVSGSAPIDGSIDAFAVIYSYKHTDPSGFYIGAGAGVSYVEDEVRSIDGDTMVAGSEDGYVPVTNIMLGHKFTGNGPDSMSFDIGYRYLYFFSSQKGLDDFTANSLFVKLSVPF